MTRTPSQADIIRRYVDARLADVHTVLPGRIESFDPETQKADVSPMLKRSQQADDGVIVEDIPVIPAVPVVFPRAGGFKITFPVERGDRCTLLFAEQSIDNYQLGGGSEAAGPPARYEAADPELFQRFDLSDPVAILGWYPDTETVAEVNSDAMVIGKDAGATIHIGEDSIILHAGDESTPLVKIGDDEINLYEASAADFVALAQKTFDEIKALRDTVDGNVTVYGTHVHPTTAPGSPTGPPAAPQTPPLPVNPVAAEKVKAT